MRDTDFDLIYAFGTSPITQALPAIVMKKRIHKPLIFNVQDLWPENVVVVTGLKNKVVLGLLEKLVDYIYSYCDLVLVPSKSFVRKIQRRKNFMPKEKVCFWPQYSVVEKASHIPERTGEFGNKKELYDIRNHWDKKKFHIVFTGNIGVAQGLDLVAKAASYLKDSPIVWHLVGGGREKEQVIEAVKKEGVETHPEIMVPLTGILYEFKEQENVIRTEAAKLFEELGDSIDFKVGTMIEIPRAALTADRIASSAEFFSFGTNDLTQMTFGYSRDDIASFLPVYLEKKILKVDPFQVLDQNGVGQLVRMATEKGRAIRPDLKCGICGEHGGEPSSVKFCHRVGLNYVSCSPFRVPIARLAAAQAAIEE